MNNTQITPKEENSEETEAVWETFSGSGEMAINMSQKWHF